MGALQRYLRPIYDSSVSIFEGLAVTLSWMARRPHTSQYPDRMEVPVDSTIADGARGLLEVDLAICTACLACKNACPIGVIDIVAGRDASGQRMITLFDIDAAKCMFCGLCTEPCPTGAIRHTKEFNLAVDDIRRLRLHFCDAPAAPYKLNKELPPAVEAPGRIIRSILMRQREGTIPVEPPPAPAQGGTPS